ncbi:MAG: hypothetical protein ABIR46_01080 [Candidatus Saccharimonadales bacterium]
MTFGFAALVKFTENNDGSTNWWKVALIVAIFLLPALIRCILTVDEGERGVRTRWGRAIRLSADGKRCQHPHGDDHPRCACRYKMVNAGPHIVVFKVHSIKTIGTRRRSDKLDMNEITHGGRNYNLQPSMRWHVSEDDDYAGRAMFDVYDPNKKDDKNTMLVSMVQEYCSDELNRAYSRTLANENGDPVYLSLDDFEEKCKTWLLEECGVVLDQLLYPNFSLDNVERQKEGMVEIADAIRDKGQVIISEDDIRDGVRRLPV